MMKYDATLTFASVSTTFMFNVLGLEQETVNNTWNSTFMAQVAARTLNWTAIMTCMQLYPSIQASGTWHSCNPTNACQVREQIISRGHALCNARSDASTSGKVACVEDGYLAPIINPM